MLRLTIFSALFVMLISAMVFADEIKTLDQAKALSSETGKPILLKFYQDDCEYCSKFAQDAINLPEISSALEKAIDLNVLMKDDHGKKLSETYKVGIYFPAFFLLNGDGEIIKRWTGYVTPSSFLNMFNEYIDKTTTVEQRVRRFEKSPTFDDAIYLAEYFTEIWDYLKANHYYFQARKLGDNPSAYAFEIFQNTANAAWQDTITYEDALPAADSALMHFQGNPRMLVKVAQIMVRLSRKLEKGDKVEKYLTPAIKATEGRGGNYHDDNILLKAEYALFIEHDTTKAVDLKKSTMVSGWQDQPNKFYPFSRWCLEHNINLDEAESFARRAADMASPGEFKGKVLNTLALICEAREKYSEAAQYMQMAIDNDPHNDYYPEKLDELKKQIGG